MRTSRRRSALTHGRIANAVSSGFHPSRKSAVKPRSVDDQVVPVAAFGDVPGQGFQSGFERQVTSSPRLVDLGCDGYSAARACAIAKSELDRSCMRQIAQPGLDAGSSACTLEFTQESIW